MKVQTKVESLDAEMAFRSMKVTLGDVEFATPIKASKADVPVGPVNEIFRELDKATLEAIVNSTKTETLVADQLLRKLRPGLNLFFVQYPDFVAPSVKEMGALADIQYQRSDVVITPLFPGIGRTRVADAISDDLVLWNSRFIDEVETLNNKTIIGMVPIFAHRFVLQTVVDALVDRDVVHFAIDMQGRVFQDTWMRAFLKILKAHRLTDTSMLYLINAREGMLSQKAEEVLAKDFITPAYSVDVIGHNHVAPPGMARIADSRKPKPPPPPPSWREFSSASYGYKRILLNPVATKYGVSIDRARALIKGRNISRQYGETLVMQQALAEAGTLLPHIGKKKMVTAKLLESLKKFRRETLESERTKQTSLFGI